jgi:arylsulfatase A-like enzyme
VEILIMKLQLICLAFLCSQLHAANKPNIVIILADDYGYGSAGCYGADGNLVRTPNIDRLAREGRRFTDANTTSSVCSPTRYSVMTGRYCWRTTLTHEVLGTFSPLHIETNRLNLASLLKAHGYRTAAVGKWHLGYGTSDGTAKWRTDYTAALSPGPLDIGFDYHFGVPSNHGDLTGVFVENRFVYGLRSGKIPDNMKVKVPDSDDFQATYTTDDTGGKQKNILALDAPRRKNDRVMPVLTDKTVHWLEQQQPGTPFFLYFTPVAVHNPVTPAKDLAGKSAAGLYGDWIHELDRSVGRVLDTLDKQGLANDTLVIFSSDNGGVFKPENEKLLQTEAFKAGLKVNGSLRGGKHSVWEGGFKVPFIVRWPGQAPAGTVCNDMVSLADILATTAAIVGDNLPAANKGAEDSHNILPAILGGKVSRPDMIVHSADGVFAIRRGPWKWIEGVPVDEIKPGARKARAEEYRAQLYNVQDDPAETKDVSATHPEVVKELAALLNRYRDGGYSRELPTVSEKAKTAIELPPVAEKVVFTDALDKVPAAPWVQVRGKWTAKDHAVWGSEKPADQAVAALRAPVALAAGDIQYEVSLPAAAAHTLRVQLSEITMRAQSAGPRVFQTNTGAWK